MSGEQAAVSLAEAEPDALTAAFVVTLVRVMRAHDAHGVWAKKSDAQLLEPFVVTKEQRRQIDFIQRLNGIHSAKREHDSALEAQIKSMETAIGDKVADLGESLRFLRAVGCSASGELARVQFFTSHEALHLPYEQTLTRQVRRFPGWFDLSAHLPWIGLRTADPDGAHVEFMSGIANPVGV